MSAQLIKRTPRAPVLSSFNNTLANNGQSTLGDSDGFNTVGSKKIEKRYADIYEQTSSNLIPTNLPSEKLSLDSSPIEATSHIIPLTIKIIRNKNETKNISRGRLLVAILQGMQNVYPDTYIYPKQVDDNHPVITNINMVKIGENLLDGYFQNATDIPTGSFIARIYVHTNNPLLLYKKDLKFSKNLSKEKIILEEVRLNEINPPNLGFIELLVPENDNLRLHTIRIRNYLPPVHPRFQLFTRTLYDSRRRGAKVVMIKCDRDDISTLKPMFQSLHEQDIIKFFSWQEFTSLNSVLRDTAFQKIFAFNKYFRSVTIQGFKDNDDNVPMKYRIKQSGQQETPGETDPLESMLVSDYLGTYTAGNGTKLFDHVYEPIKGTRDTMVLVDNHKEAQMFSEVALIELSREMTSASRIMVFENPEEVVKNMSIKTKWQPFKKAAELMLEQQSMEFPNNKRVRVENGQPKPYPGWRNLGGGIPNPINQSGKNTTTPKANQSAKKQSAKDTSASEDKVPTWEEIQAHVQESINTNTRVLRTEIQEVHYQNSKRIDDLENKLDTLSNNMEEKLDKIADQSDSTFTVVHNLNAMLAKMWGSASILQDTSGKENKKPMEYDLTRDEQLLKRKADIAKIYH
jgi:hypothetical protein